MLRSLNRTRNFNAKYDPQRYLPQEYLKFVAEGTMGMGGYSGHVDSLQIIDKTLSCNKIMDCMKSFSPIVADINCDAVGVGCEVAANDKLMSLRLNVRGPSSVTLIQSVLSSLDKFPSLQRLEIYGGDIDTSELEVKGTGSVKHFSLSFKSAHYALVGLESMGNLDELGVYNKYGSGIVYGLPSTISSLSLGNVIVSDLTWNAFTSFEKLESLSIDNNVSGSSDWLVYILGLTNLKRLHISDRIEGGDLLAIAGSFGDLKELELTGCKISSLPTFKNLEMLEIHNYGDELDVSNLLRFKKLERADIISEYKKFDHRTFFQNMNQMSALSRHRVFYLKSHEKKSKNIYKNNENSFIIRD